jgi:tetratricopeptide (TPR) repeat protein
MNFAHPWLLVLALPVLPLAWLYARRHRGRRDRNRFALVIVSALSLVLAAARPYWSTTPEKRVVRGADLIILLDVSQSMFCPVDGGGRRIDQARNFLRTLLPEFAGSSVSVIYFAGDAQIGCPLTTDLSAIHLFLDSVAPAMTGQPGSNPEALQATLSDFLTSIKSSQIQDGKQQLGLLFSDGEFSSAAASLKNFVRKQKGFSLLTFICGKGKAAVPKYDLSGNYPGAFSEVRSAVLQSLSTEGSYNLSQAGPETIGKEVAGNVREIITGGHPAPKYQSTLFILIAFLALLSYQIHPLIARAAPGAAGAAYRLALALLLMTAVSMSPENRKKEFTLALEDTRANKFDEAIRRLEALRKEGASEEIEVATGNVYFLQKRYDQAIRYYEKALQKNPNNNGARWNWEVALKRKQAPQNPPPPSPPRPEPTPSQLPREAKALLKYFDQQERQQMQLTNSINAHTEKFAW